MINIIWYTLEFMAPPIVRHTLADPYKILEIVQKLAPKSDNLIYKKKDTIWVIPKILKNGPELHKKIYAALVSKYPLSKFKESTDGNIKKIRVVGKNTGTGEVYTQCPVGKRSSILNPGRAYELYFHSVIVDKLLKLTELKSDLKEFSYLLFEKYHNVTLTIWSVNKKKIGIGPIISIDDAAGKSSKSDVTIQTKLKKVRISLKQSNFFSWGSAGTYHTLHSARPKKLIDKAVATGLISLDPTDRNKVIFPEGIMGIRTPATDSEINYYCFGMKDNFADYIIINGKEEHSDEDSLFIYMEAEKIYKRNHPPDTVALRPEVYMVIYDTTLRSKDPAKDSNSTAMYPYKNLSVQFVNRNHAMNGDILRKKKYLECKL